MMFNAAKSHMEGTRLWEIVSKMPKGALLHAQYVAMTQLFTPLQLLGC
jgi:adenosine deaminase CECR1